MTRTKVTIVSSDQAHLQEIAGLLERHPDVGEVLPRLGTVRTLEEISEPPDVLIINGALAEQGGLDTLERLGHRHPDAAFIVVSENHSPEFLLRAMRAGVREVVGCPVREDDLHAAMSRVKRRGAPGGDGKLFAFMSCKGGAGSTFLATNFGYALAELTDRKVAFLDLNLQFGDAALFMSEHRPATDLAHLSREIHRLDASLLAASMVNVRPNYALLAAPEDPGQAIDVTAQHVASIVRLARRHNDYVVVDLGRSLDAVTLQVLDMADLVFPVLQLSLPFIRDGKRLLAVLRSLGYSRNKVNLVVNRRERGGEIELSDLEKTVGMRVFKCIPNSYRSVAASVNQGIPIAKLARNDPVARAIAELAGTVEPEAVRSETGWLTKMLKRH